MITMLEAQLLPKRIIRIYEEGGSIVQASFRKETRRQAIPPNKKESLSRTVNNSHFLSIFVGGK